MTWQLQEAKNRFREILANALSAGPQIVTRKGIEMAVVLSMDDFRKLKKSDSDIIDFFRKAPLYGVDLDIDRRKQESRPVEL